MNSKQDFDESIKDILQELGVNEPFTDDNGYSKEAIKALESIINIIKVLNSVGAITETGDELENYIYEIISSEI